MTQTEWIISLDDDLKDYDELFVGNVRDGDRLIRCKDCKHHGEQYGNGYCMKDGCYGWSDEDYCSRAERREKKDDC